MPSNQYESLYDRQVTQFLAKAKLVLAESEPVLKNTLYEGEGKNDINRIHTLKYLAAEIDKLGHLAAETYTIYSTGKLKSTYLIEHLEQFLTQIDEKIKQLIKEGIKNCFITNENLIVDRFLTLQNGEQLFNTFKADVEKIYGPETYKRFFDPIIHDKEQQFVNDVISYLENSNPSFDSNTDNILDITELTPVLSKASAKKWGEILEGRWKVAAEAKALKVEKATNEMLIDMMQNISKDYKDNANMVQIKARENDLTFLKQCVIQIHSDKNLDIVDKTNLLQGAIYSVLDILREEKLNSSIGVGRLYEQLKNIQNEMRTLNTDKVSSEIYKDDFKMYLQFQKGTFDEFHLTKKILSSQERAPSTFTVLLDHYKHNQQQRPEKDNRELSPSSTSKPSKKP